MWKSFIFVSIYRWLKSLSQAVMLSRARLSLYDQLSKQKPVLLVQPLACASASSRIQMSRGEDPSGMIWGYTQGGTFDNVGPVEIGDKGDSFCSYRDL